MNKHIKGACGEHLAVAALLRNGYQVHRNVAHSGVDDLIITNGKETFRVQVKTFYINKRGHTVAELRSSAPTGHRTYENLVDLMLVVDVDTGEVFLFPSSRQTQAHKNTLSKFKIFPIDS